MSVHVSSWVWKHAEAAGNDRLVLLALADIANDEGKCWPSQTFLAERTKLSLSTVKRSVRALREQGVLVVEEAYLGRSNVYRIDQEVGQSDLGNQGQSDLGQSDTGVNLTGEVGHSYDLGGRSAVTYNTSLNHQDTSIDVPDLPKGERSPVAFPRPFTVTKAMREYAAEHARHVDVDGESRRFVEYWREGEGKGKRKKNWVLTWMGWMRRAEERIPVAPVQAIGFEVPEGQEWMSR